MTRFDNHRTRVKCANLGGCRRGRRKRNVVDFQSALRSVFRKRRKSLTVGASRSGKD